MEKLEIWVVYDKPIDYPDKYVVRKWLYDKPTETFYTADTLEDIRSKIPEGLHKLDRFSGDDPKIIETWI